MPVLRSTSLYAMTLSALLLAGCSGGDESTAGKDAQINPDVPGAGTRSMMEDNNPFYAVSELDLQYPRFDLIRNEHFRPAFLRGMAQQQEEIGEITRQTAAPTFANTIVPLEISGQLLKRVATVFFSLGSADTNDVIQDLEAEISPMLSAHADSILLNDELFARVRAVHEDRDNGGLDPESLRLLDKTWRDFIRAGAMLDGQQKTRLVAINAELAELSAIFDRNVLGESNADAIIVDNRDDLAGLSEADILGAADAAEARGLAGRYVIPLLNTSGQPVLSVLQNRDLRKRIMEASLARGSHGGDFDNTGVLSRAASLRAERAQLLGYGNHAEYVLEEQTALAPAAVNAMLAALMPRAIANARAEAEKLQELIDAEGQDFRLAVWDRAFYAEKLRNQQYSFDESVLRPYFEFNNVLRDGVFYAANRIYGISVTERFDLPVYHPDVRVFEITDNDGSLLSLFIIDPYARPSKRGGEWMNELVSQSTLLDTRTVVANYLNIPKPPAGEPTLLTFDEVIALFHEFGHALHGMFSNVTYPAFAGTNVPNDFVEYPSQVNEMWATWPEVLQHYAMHYQTGQPMPEELLGKVMAIRQYGQGFATSEYLMAAVTDLALHQLGPDEVPVAGQLMQFETDSLAAAGANPEELPPRYRLPYFLHIMGGYAAGYYSYIWSEVLDADTVEWFRSNGGMLRENGQHFRDTLLSRGGSEDAMVLFGNFRGREPDIAPLLQRRGLE
jgi:peptidyl-dipeptidase Dcp